MTDRPALDTNIMIYAFDKKDDTLLFILINWVEPVELEFSQGMKVNDLKIAEQLIVDHLELIKTKRYEVHGC